MLKTCILCHILVCLVRRRAQAWREQVASGAVVEMSPSEVKRLKWSEEQVEIMKETNANLRYHHGKGQSARGKPPARPSLVADFVGT